MIFVNSMKNLLRARSKTALFFALILILTLLVGLDGFVWLSVTRYLDACDKNFTTIGLVEYMGAEYPNENIYDSGMAKAAAVVSDLNIAENRNVLHWDASARVLGYTEGFTRTDRDVYDKNRAILVIRASIPQTDGLYWANVAQTLYSYTDRTEHIMFVDTNGYCSLESGHYYLVSGAFFTGPSSYAYFGLSPFRDTNVVCTDITDPSAKCGYTVPEDSLYTCIADTVRVLNNCLDVHATGDVEAQLPFHQNQLRLSSGRFFTEAEYAAGEQVCLVSEAFAGQLSCGVGDSIPLSFMHAGATTAYESYRADNGFASSGSYTIVGVMATPDAMRHYVYVPRLADPLFAENTFGYTVGTARIKNGTADSFWDDIQSRLPDRVRMTIYDQGYAAAEKPFREVLRITAIVSAVCLLAGLCILLLFGFLFVYRQRDVSVAMIRLGTGKKRVSAYFLYGAGLLAFVSAGVGAVCGYLLSSRMGAIISRTAASVTLADSSYSNAAQSIVKALPFTPTASALPFWLAATAVFLLSMLLCFLFTVGTFRKKRVRKPRAAVPEKAEPLSVSKESRAGYAFVSIARGGARCIIAPLTALLAVIFLCELRSSVAAYRAEYEELFENTTINGYITDTHGKVTGKLAVFGSGPNELLRSGYIDDMWLTKSNVFIYEGVSVSDGKSCAFDYFEFPTSDYGLDTLWNRILAGPSLVFTNSLEHAPEFFYSSIVQTEYLDGYGPDVLQTEFDWNTPMPCLLSSSFMAEKGIKLGDTISIIEFFDAVWMSARFESLVVGSYVKAGVKDNIYCPLSGYVHESTLMAAEDDPAYDDLIACVFNSVDFTLKDAGTLAEFKAYLKKSGFSDLNHASMKRVFILLDDKQLNDTAETLSRQIRYVGTLYPVLYALTYLVGLVAAYLMMINRRKEYAIMRLLGTPPCRAFFNLFLEQLVLCVPGAALGLALAFPIGCYTDAGALLAGGFSVCWLVGSAAALLHMSGSAVLVTLHEEE